MRIETNSVPTSWYADDVMRELDFNWDGRIDFSEPFLPFRMRDFLWMADRNHDWAVDRFELSQAIDWQIDRNHDWRIDKSEHEEAVRRYEFPARAFSFF